MRLYIQTQATVFHWSLEVLEFLLRILIKIQKIFDDISLNKMTFDSAVNSFNNSGNSSGTGSSVRQFVS